MARLRKGQVFIIGALLFSSILLMVFFASGNPIKGQSTSTFQDYYTQSFTETGHAFNSALNGEVSPGNLKRTLYRYDRFVELQAEKKSIKYGSINFFALPDSGEAVFINYMDRNITADIIIDGNSQTINVESKQWKDLSFTSGTTTFRVITDNPGIDTEFDAASPRLLNYAEMSRENEVWSNYRVH